MGKQNILTVPLRTHGNSTGLTIPKVFLVALGLTKDSKVDVILKNGSIEMKPHIESLTLEDLFKGYDPKIHNHGESLPGDYGNEVVEY